MKMEPMVITLNVHVDGDNPHLAHEFAERLTKAMSAPTVAAEQDAEQWVELNGYWRISTDGTRVQRRDWCDDSDPWVDTKDSPDLVKLYRAGLTHGREVAEAENAALREQVRALVEAVGNAGVHSCNSLLPSVGGWNSIKAAAKAVQL